LDEDNRAFFLKCSGEFIKKQPFVFAAGIRGAPWRDQTPIGVEKKEVHSFEVLEHLFEVLFSLLGLSGEGIREKASGRQDFCIFDLSDFPGLFNQDDFPEWIKELRVITPPFLWMVKIANQPTFPRIIVRGQHPADS
jgi:hypothetical protein